MSEFIEIVYFAAPEAERAYRRWVELHEDVLRRMPPNAMRVETGRDRNDGIYVRVRAQSEVAKLLSD